MTCAVTDAGAAKCWGYGIVGNGSPEGSSPTPVDIVGLSSGVVAITQGDLHVCAHLADRVSCWGRNDYGQLGDGSRETRLVPTDVVGLGGPIQAVSAGSESTCAVISPGTLKCWGNNRAGQLGDGTSEGVPLPQIVVVPGDAIFSDGFE
jgi:alpha-tubulin suppressor-like RCC1 family protein